MTDVKISDNGGNAGKTYLQPGEVRSAGITCNKDDFSYLDLYLFGEAKDGLIVSMV